MAGEGKRFRDAGYSFPKPLIEVRGKMMIEWAIKCAPPQEGKHFIFLVRPGFPWENVLSKLVDSFDIIEVQEETGGAACTCLLAKMFIDNDTGLFIMNSDQYVEWLSGLFWADIESGDYDGAILTFKSAHPKWSYARIKEDPEFPVVMEVAEKNPISRDATCGIYYFKKGSDFVRGAEHMIIENKRFNGEFYVCPVYNELISDGKFIMPFQVTKMVGLGTPEDVDTFNRSVEL